MNGPRAFWIRFAVKALLSLVLTAAAFAVLLNLVTKEQTAIRKSVTDDLIINRRLSNVVELKKGYTALEPYIPVMNTALPDYSDQASLAAFFDYLDALGKTYKVNQSLAPPPDTPLLVAGQYEYLPMQVTLSARLPVLLEYLTALENSPYLLYVEKVRIEHSITVEADSQASLEIRLFVRKGGTP